MPHAVRFRLWHLFALIGIVAVVLYLVTQVGMETAEIEIVQFDTWSRNDSDDPIAPIEVANVEFRYLRPDELKTTSLRIFLAEKAFTHVRNIGIGSRFSFRYRAKQLLWLKPVRPDPIAIRLLGLNPADIEEIITEVNLYPDGSHE